MGNYGGSADEADEADEAIAGTGTGKVATARPGTATAITARHLDINSPVGALRLVARGDALVAVTWGPADQRSLGLGPTRPDANHPVLIATRSQLAGYFAGDRRHFDLPLAFEGTPFQCRVWSALLTLAFGQTARYRDLAGQLGQPRAVRAVGAANGRNPLSIIVPCHRLIGADGSLTGYAGGLAAKAWLLAHEGVTPMPAQPQASRPRKPPL